jgi:hypothetical protein
MWLKKSLVTEQQREPSCPVPVLRERALCLALSHLTCHLIYLLVENNEKPVA